MSKLPPREPDGKLPAYAWPGGYAIVYYTQDGGSLCAGCANGENGSEATTERRDGFTDPVPSDEAQWLLVAAEPYWEGPVKHCDHCNKELPSEYGDPDEEKNDGRNVQSGH